MRLLRWLLAVSLSAACSSAGPSQQSAQGSPDAGDPVDTTPDAGAILNSACVPGSTCLVQGDNAFESAGDERRVTVLLPANPQGAPAVFAWHYLGGSRQELIDWMQLQRLADAGYVVVVPQSRTVADTEWDVQGAPENNRDVTFFDALLDALTAQYGVAPARIYTTGFSAGGLFATYLTMHRASVLRATAPFSGGVPQGAYVAPATGLPVMISWGGTSDVLYGFDFDAAAHLFAQLLTSDGHAVALCNHGQGHWLPDNAMGHLLAFFGDHGADPSLAWSVAPTRIPSECTSAATRR